MKRTFKGKVVIYFCVIGYLLLVINYVDCEISKKLQRIVKKINKGDIRSLSRAVRIIESVPGIKMKFKIWNFFYRNIKANKLIKESVKHSMWRYLYHYINQLVIEGIEKYKVCSFSVPPRKFQYVYFLNSNLLYLSVPGIPSNGISCEDNVKIVDEIKYTVVKDDIAKAIVYVDKQKIYVNVENKRLFGPYKDVDYIYFDNEYKNYAFVYNNGTRLNFNGKQIKLKYHCVNPIGIFKDEVHLVCNSRKYSNSQFLYYNKSSVLCNKNSIYYKYSQNGDIVYICNNKNLKSIFFNNQLVKRYLPSKLISGFDIYNVTIESKYVVYSVGTRQSAIRVVYRPVVYDTITKKVQRVISDSNLVFLNGNYFYCKLINSNIVIYKNNEKFKEIKTYGYSIWEDSNIYLTKISNYAFYTSLYNPKKGGYRYFIVMLNGTIDVIDSVRYIYPFKQESEEKGDGFIINAFDFDNVGKCYIYNGEGKIVKDGYHCHYYKKNFKSRVFVKYKKEEDKSEVYIEKYKRKIEIEGFVGSDLYGYYIGKRGNFLYLARLIGSEQVLFIPILDRKTFVLGIKNNVILPVLDRVTYYYDLYISFDELYLLPEFPINVAAKIEKIIKFCKYQKRLCGMN